PASFAGADADAFFQRGDEDLAVADLTAAVAGTGEDRLHGNFDEVVVTGDVQTNLVAKVRHDDLPAGDLSVLLPAVTGAAAHADARNLGADQGLAHFVQFIGLNNGGDEFHRVTSIDDLIEIEQTVSRFTMQAVIQTGAFAARVEPQADELLD